MTEKEKKKKEAKLTVTMGVRTEPWLKNFLNELLIEDRIRRKIVKSIRQDFRYDVDRESILNIRSYIYIIGADTFRPYYKPRYSYDEDILSLIQDADFSSYYFSIINAIRYELYEHQNLVDEIIEYIVDRFEPEKWVKRMKFKTTLIFVEKTRKLLDSIAMMKFRLQKAIDFIPIHILHTFAFTHGLNKILEITNIEIEEGEDEEIVEKLKRAEMACKHEVNRLINVIKGFIDEAKKSYEAIDKTLDELDYTPEKLFFLAISHSYDILKKYNITLKDLLKSLKYKYFDKKLISNLFGVSL